MKQVVPNEPLPSRSDVLGNWLSFRNAVSAYSARLGQYGLKTVAEPAPAVSWAHTFLGQYGRVKYTG